MSVPKIEPEPQFRMPMPKRGEAVMVVVYRSDDDQVVSFRGEMDRWICTAMQTRTQDVHSQLLAQASRILADLITLIYRRFGLGALEAPKDDA